MCDDESVAKPMKMSEIIRISDGSKHSIFGHRYKLNENGDVRPLEFTLINDKNRFIVEGNRRLFACNAKPFLDELALVLFEFGLLDVFGIAIKAPNSGYGVHGTIETTDDQQRIQTTRTLEKFDALSSQNLHKEEEGVTAQVLFTFDDEKMVD